LLIDQDALPLPFHGWQVFRSVAVSRQRHRKMLENFMNLNQFPDLVKQQLDSLFQIFQMGARRVLRKKQLFFSQDNDRSPQFF
jgi:hypothetical protein